MHSHDFSLTVPQLAGTGFGPSKQRVVLFFTILYFTVLLYYSLLHCTALFILAQPFSQIAGTVFGPSQLRVVQLEGRHVEFVPKVFFLNDSIVIQ